MLSEKIPFNNRNDNQLAMSSFMWLPHLNSYIEGTTKGQLRVRDLNKKGECTILM